MCPIAAAASSTRACSAARSTWSPTPAAGSRWSRAGGDHVGGAATQSQEVAEPAMLPVVADRASHGIVQQAVALLGEVDVAGDVVAAQRGIGGLIEERREAIDESHAARRRPGAPV